LVDQTLRAFRTAHRADRSILVPELNRIAWLFRHHPRFSAQSGEGQGVCGGEGGRGSEGARRGEDARGPEGAEGTRRRADQGL